MNRIASRDAAYLYLGDGHRSATVLSVWVLRTPPGALGVDDGEIVARLRRMTEIEGHMRCRVQFVPFSLGLPSWRVDPEFDVSRHLVRHRGHQSWSDVLVTLAEIGESRLPSDRPLWRAHLIPEAHDVPGTGRATLLAIQWHHAMYDGLRWGQLTRHVLADGPPDDAVPRPIPWSPDPDQPGSLAVMARELRETPRVWGRFAAQVVRGIVSRRARARSAVSVPSTRPPSTVFSGRLTGPRICAFVGLDLSAVIAVKQACPGVTVNDVVLSVIAGAFRDQLHAMGDPPTGSLSALVPVSTRDACRTSNTPAVNRFRATAVDLHTDITDPRARLAAISVSAGAAKSSVLTDAGADRSPEVPGPLLRLLGVLSRTARTSGPPVANLAVTNVGGIGGGITLAGAPVDVTFGMQTLETGCLIAHCVHALGSRLIVSVTTDAHVLPDLTSYLDRIARSLDEHRVAIASAA